MIDYPISIRRGESLNISARYPVTTGDPSAEGHQIVVHFRTAPANPVVALVFDSADTATGLTIAAYEPAANDEEASFVVVNLRATTQAIRWLADGVYVGDVMLVRPATDAFGTQIDCLGRMTITVEPGTTIL